MNAFEKDAGPLAGEAKLFLDCLLRIDKDGASQIITKTIERGTNIKDIYISLFQASQYEIGRLWETNKINVAQEHYCTAVTQVIMSQLYPTIFKHKKNGRRLVATCVNGELHEMGIRMVADIFEIEGWDTYYLGANTPIKSILESLSQFKAQLICISATINVNGVSELIAEIRKSADAAGIKILVGGRLFNTAPELWRKIGADGYAKDALEAVSIANQMPG
jgi:methanogenic corrinoid protein MtbC1